MSSLWLMLSPWIIRTLTSPPLLASLVPRNFRRYHTPTIYLPQNSHHTYLSWHLHSHSKIYCHATFHRSVCYDTLHHCHIALHDHVVDIVFVAKSPFINFFMHVTLDSLHIPVHCQRHSHRFIFCSKYWFVSKRGVMIIIIRALSQWGNDDGDYVSPTSRDETPDGKKEKKRPKKRRPK